MPPCRGKNVIEAWQWSCLEQFGHSTACPWGGKGVLKGDIGIRLEISSLEFSILNKGNALDIKHEIGTGSSPTKQDDSEETKKGEVEFFKEDDDDWATKTNIKAKKMKK